MYVRGGENFFLIFMFALQPVEQLLLDLLAVPSVSGSEHAFAEMLCQKLSADFVIQRIPVDEQRFCVLATRGNPKTLFVAHMDTVVAEVDVHCEESFIFGRGSCDNKGSLSAMICALKEANDVGLLCTVGEETTFDGAKSASAWLKEHTIIPERIIIGEPTHLQIVTGQRGVLCLEITCKGVEEHSSTDHPQSAIHTLVNLLHALQETRFSDTTMNVALISGGKAENMVAGEARATVVWRSLLPDIKMRVQEALGKIDVPHTHLMKKELAPVDHTSAEFPKNTVAYFTEMFFFDKGIVLGPGGIEDAHTPQEKVSREELKKAVELYKNLII